MQLITTGIEKGSSATGEKRAARMAAPLVGLIALFALTVYRQAGSVLAASAA